MSRRHKNKTLAIAGVLLIAALGCLLLWASSRLFDLDKDGAGTVALILATEVFLFDLVLTVRPRIHKDAAREPSRILASPRRWIEEGIKERKGKERKGSRGNFGKPKVQPTFLPSTDFDAHDWCLKNPHGLSRL